MSQMETSLGKYLLPVKSLNPEAIYGSDEFPYLDIASVNRELKCITTPQTISTSDASSRARQLVQKNDIIVSTVRPNLNTVAMVEDAYDNAIASTGFCVLRANPNRLDYRYLYHWISSQKIVDYLISVATGASYPAVSDKIIKGISFNPPELKEQKRIAAILDKADSLRRKRQQAIQLADDFLRATFLDMFGDPVTNPKGWPMRKLAQVGTLDRGISKHRPRNEPSLLDGPYPLIQTGEVANCDGYIRSFSKTYSEKGLQQSKMWPTGTLCITIAANIAKTGILTFDACFPDSVVGFSAPQRSSVEYVRFWLSFLQKTLEENAPESAQKNINLAILRDLNIPWPPSKSIDDFCRIIDVQNKVKMKQDACSETIKTLEAALNDRLLSA